MTTDRYLRHGLKGAEDDGGAHHPLLTIAHLSDLHLDDAARATERAEQVIQHIERRRDSIDLIIVTGDITESAVTPPEDVITQTEARLEAIAPTLICIGNSDRPRFNPEAVARHRTSQRVGSLLALALDSTVPGEAHGWIDADDITWLNDQAGAPAVESVVIALHHPPIRLGHPVIDQWRAFGAVHALEEFVASRPVVITVAGHTHAATSTTFGGKPLVIAPGVHSAGRHRADFAAGLTSLIDESAPPSYLLHTLGDRTTVSQHVFIGAT